MPILPLAGGSMYLARVRSVPLAGEGLGVGQPPHTGSHRARLHDRTNYGKRYKSPWGCHSNLPAFIHLSVAHCSLGFRLMLFVPVFVPTRVNREALATERRVSASAGCV